MDNSKSTHVLLIDSKTLQKQNDSKSKMLLNVEMYTEITKYHILSKYIKKHQIVAKMKNNILIFIFDIKVHIFLFTAIYVK